MIRLASEIGVGGVAIGGAVLTQVAGAATGDPLAALLLSEFGPFGVVVFLLYRRLNRVEEKVDELASGS